MISTKGNEDNYIVLKENTLFTGILLEKQARQLTIIELCCSKYDPKNSMNQCGEINDWPEAENKIKEIENKYMM